jgi:isoleucyl-tRNA synthetase
VGNFDQIYWCPKEATGLTANEIYFANQLNPSLYVKFDLTKEALQLLPDLQAIALREGAVRVSIIGWTTMPWSLPANRGLGLYPQSDYVVIKAPTIDGTELWIVAKEQQSMFERSVGFGDKLSTPLLAMKAERFHEKYALHPWLDRPSKIFLDSHVTLEAGTGAVPVTADYRADKIEPNETSNKKVIDHLMADGHLAGQTEIQQSIPRCKRCRNPAIIRSPGLGTQLGMEAV